MVPIKRRSSKKRASMTLKSMTEHIAEHVSRMSPEEARAQLHPETLMQLNHLPDEAELAIEVMMDEIKPSSPGLKKYLMQETVKTLGSKKLLEE